MLQLGVEETFELTVRALRSELQVLQLDKEIDRKARDLYLQHVMAVQETLREQAQLKQISWQKALRKLERIRHHVVQVTLDGVITTRDLRRTV